MTDLSRDARTLVARVRKQDGPSAADRARLRGRLEAAWAAQRAENAAASLSDAVAVPAQSARGLQPTAAAILIVSLGFLSPELPPGPAEPRPAQQRVPRDAPQSVARSDVFPQNLASPAGSPELARAVTRRDSDAAADRLSARSVAPTIARASLGPEPGARSLEPARAAPTVASAPVGTARAARSRSIRARSSLGLEPGARSPEPARAEQRRGFATVAKSTSTRAPTADRARASGPEPGARSPEPAAPERGASSASADATAPPQATTSRFRPQAIDDELAWLAAAQDALRDGHPTRALTLVQEHAFRFPRGALARERSAVQALALCALERREAARSVLTDLARRAPSSPLVDRVRRSCGL